GTAAATGVVVNSTTSISVTAPAGSGTVDVTVAASGGTSATTAADEYTYAAAPTVTSVSPSLGPSTGGTSVTITGTNFTGTQAVEFGTVAATSFTVNSATSITATPRAESTGTVDVTVLTPGGTSATSSADRFTFVTPSPPTVTSVSPSSGPTSGGTSVIITGTNFTGASAVDFGSTPATGFVVNSATSITATAPAGATGAVDVTVTTPGGKSATGSADQFAYVVSAVSITAAGTMASAASTGVTTLAVTPQHVGDLMLLAVKVASTSVSASSVSGGGVGTWTRAEGPYTGYAGHDIEIWKGTVSTTGASTITVTFSGSVTSIATGLVSQEFSGAGSGTAWSVDTGAGISNASSATVTFPKLTPSASGELYFAYDAVANTAAAGTTSGFTYGLTPDGNVATYDTDVSAATQPVTTQSPAGVSGGLGVLITATGSSTALPTVTGVSPASGSTAGGTSVTVTGTNLTGASSVMFGATAATNVVVNSSSSITATSPAEPAWQTDITVTAPGGTSATGAADKFTFVAAAPTATGTPHVMVVMMENESYSDLIGNSEAPNVNQLAQDYGLATQSYAIGHPSLPNYLELLAGSNYGVTDDGTPQSEGISASASTLANQLETAGISWRGYFEAMPSAGYTGGDTGGTDPYGGEYYLQHHNPFVYFPAVTSLSDFATNVVPLSTNFSTDLNSATPPAFVWVSPNAVDDMHDGPLMTDGDTVPTVGDAWLGKFVGGVQASSWYAAGGQIVIEVDEGVDSDTSGVGTAGEGGGGQVATLVVSSALAATPQQDATSVNTAGVLHSIEKLYGVPFLADAATTANGNIDSLMTATPSTTPTVTGVSPGAGPTGGGTSVTVTGTNFTGVTAVKFGTTAATGVTVNGATSLTVTAPAGTGTVDVTVSASGGTSSTGSADHYTYAAAPTVTSVVPGSGPTGGGTSVTVTGTNLTGATAVKFGTAAATGVTVNSPTSITATAPAGTGTVDVTVTTPGGTSATSPADQFTYVVSTTPTVTGVSPSSGPAAGGTSVTVTGTNFTGVTAVKFGTAAATGVTVNSPTSITATAPPGTGTVDVTVVASGGTSATTSADHYTYTSSAATIAVVGTLVNGSGDGTTTLAVSPQHVGDLLVLVVKAESTTITVSSVSGGGVGTWAQAEDYAGYSGHDLEIWTGTVTTTGASTIAVTFSASVTAVYTGLAAQEFSASSGSSTVWAVGSGSGISNTSSTTVTLPKLTPTGTGELYFGYAAIANNGAAGTTTGFTYATTSDADVATYDTNVSAAIQPTAKQSPAGVSGAVGVLISALA
ncbi:MAG: IPT/TIG domain-containing protein, partial [Acidimicrobiales bacterium]